jgi:hypothetical protein
MRNPWVESMNILENFHMYILSMSILEGFGSVQYSSINTIRNPAV